MQNRMKQNPLPTEEINELLKVNPVGTISTLLEDGAPYAVPVHFVLYEGNVYVHGLPKGQKIDNILKDPRVCFETFEMAEKLLDDVDTACSVNTEFKSVIITGKASIVDEYSKKETALNAIVKKYTPQFADKTLPENMVNGTAVIEIVPIEITGKYYKDNT